MTVMGAGESAKYSCARLNDICEVVLDLDEKYNIERKKFGVVTPTDINYFKSVLSEDRVLTDESEVMPFNIDWIKNCRGQSQVVLKPKTVEEVSQILTHCNAKKLAVCPQGGNTGLVGGSVPVFDEIVLSLALMNKIISLDEISGSLVCEAGCILENLEQHAKEHNLIMPLDLGAKGTCHIGGVNNFEDILKLYRSAKLSLGEILSAFEMADAAAIDACVSSLKLTNPISSYPFYVLIETHGSNETHDSEKLGGFLEQEMASGLILDGTVSSDPNKIHAMWTLRESISTAVLLDGYVFKYDVSLPLKDYYKLVPKLKQRLGPTARRVCGYGHIGDGNIHINVSIPAYDKRTLEMLEPFIYEEVAKLDGSISAEHGIGFRKPHYIHYSKDATSLQLMKDIKQLMDPNGILNPYKVLPD
ncbi:D-2-hydroxyglutarate dehydrogenase, mitochondrial [Eumeta japonica]|uniref:D-2-hydroxyglutarate dehydrogenase, mitochondrial n=1 Tax=Eumeta variegata TaxID=151549 RepID=A0A4C1VU35_EUMVA|nr:D-2-hydroxyglutarate dehydrogenase, mitochondrial [Eumeta japonica]